MLERNRSHLTHLTIRAIVFTAEEVLQFFLCVPPVTTLEVEDAKILHRRTGVYLVLKSLIAPLQQLHQAEDCDEGNELENLGDDGDDSEDEENLDKGKKEMNVEIPSGKCLLPRLSDLRLVIRPRNRLLLELVHSRWKPFSRAMGSSSRDSDEVCVCLQKLSVRYPGKAGERARKRLEVLQENLVKFKEDGMGVEIQYLDLEKLPLNLDLT
ncbi:hypothetical protein BT96DRAFT_931464 [Gymnopus androsaceus JB14]|uniref:Uncharacterized protein n=1 Tax=Gymnopus androsaceus JB14 TaxID=1447944 RepID=A0A6A4IH77_9AGAR|nr:hypothetical protein BT96DRAFT_931464 [Gymnopus androsaceus JB14]